MASTSLDLGLGLEGTHVLITGGAGLIGRVVVEHCVAAGAKVSSLDISRDASSNSSRDRCITIHCDVSSESSVQDAFVKARERFGTVQVCVALASLDLSVLSHSSFVDASFEQLKRVLDVNIAGTWLTAREWLRGLKAAKEQGERLSNVSLIIVGSESGHFGERSNVDYSLGKSAVQGGLLMSLRGEVGKVWEGGARVNCVAPGAVDTERWTQECKENPEQYWLEAQATTGLRQPIPREAVAKTILFLASENFSSHVHGQVVNVDGGKQGKIMWTKEECS